jgi:chromosome transmission fidelity protein 1
VNETEVSLKKGSDCVGKCPYLTQRGVNELKEDILSSVQDIEEVLNAGKQQDSCSFYASRAAIKEADVIVLPYNLLFHPKSRDSYGITLDKNSVVIIDEAHNLLDTITSLHSCQVTLEQMIKCFFQLTSYINKYEKRLNPDNLNFMRQLETIVKNVIKFMRASDPKSQGQVMNATEFLISASIESINLFKLMDFLDRSQLARKLFGFSCTRVSVPPKEPVKDDPSNIKPDQKKEPTIRKGGTSSLLCRIKDKKKVSSSHNVVKNDNKLLVNGTGKTADDAKIETQSVKPQSISPLYVLQDLLNCLLNPTADGVIILSTSQDFNVTLKYFLLNASDHLKDVVTNSRCIILAGGTMKPFEEYTDLLFKPMKINGLSERILTFSCGHVTPADNVLCLSMTHGVNRNLPLNYSFSSRSSKELIDETGRVISNLCKIIPHGVVVFFSSYDYLETMFSRWESTKIIEAIQANGKKVFKEPRSASMVEKVLSEYEKVNTGRTGGILLSVVGGKVSEGINFSDNMCRCVIVIGMPYGNSTSPEMKEKMSFFDRCLGQGQGRFYYENLCFKGVNQSIGRSIRHKEDYSVILLMDERYSKKDCQVRKSLPSWIGQRYMSGLDHDAAEREIKNFFSNKNK